jgi:hypothetical protein
MRGASARRVSLFPAAQAGAFSRPQIYRPTRIRARAWQGQGAYTLLDTTLPVLVKLYDACSGCEVCSWLGLASLAKLPFPDPPDAAFCQHAGQLPLQQLPRSDICFFTTFQSTSICRSSPDLRMQRVPFKVSAKNDEVTSCNAPSGEQLRTYVLPFIQAYPGQPVAAVAAATVDLAALAGDGCCAHAVASMCSPGLSLVA